MRHLAGSPSALGLRRPTGKVNISAGGGAMALFKNGQKKQNKKTTAMFRDANWFAGVWPPEPAESQKLSGHQTEDDVDPGVPV